MFLEVYTWTETKQILLDGLALYNFWPHREVDEWSTNLSA